MPMNTIAKNVRLRAHVALVSCGSTVLVLGGCRAALQLEKSDHPTVLSRQLLNGPSPSSPGEYGVRTLYYGHGDDKNRPVYRDSVAFTTETVDGSKLVDLGASASSRNSYWGFTPEEFPLNARVWYPDGDGPFPLVLVVHGNHNMRDFSDPGYDYLGELLATRGYILASVDENFMNGGIRGENDGRGWLLLKHLEAWRGFNEDEENPFFQKVDMEHLALMGHSRRGEAVGHAAAFNRLGHYPDDASLTFDFNFDIKAIIAIAPVDGQYLPTDRYVPVNDVSYMVFHGSHDGDVTSFHGIRLFNRIRFTDGEPRLKAAVYVYRANHGQWNTVWGSHDSGPRSGRRLDLRGLLDPEEQREFAMIYVSAFLDYTLKGDKRYLPLFRDHRVAGGWLPKTMYITRFEESSFRPLATFEEDIDVTTGTADGVALRGDSLATWSERQMSLRSSNRPNTSSSQINQAVWLGWNNEIWGTDGEMGPPARFVITLPDTLGSAWRLGEEASLQLALTATDAKPEARKSPADTTEGQGQEGGPRDQRSGGDRHRDDQDEDEPEEPIDLSIEIVDAAGRSASVPLSDYGPVRRPLEMRILRRADQEQRFANRYELLLQSYSIPLGDFRRLRPALDLRALKEVRLVFDRTAAGTVVLDDVGFAFLDPAYEAVRVPPGDGGR